MLSNILFLIIVFACFLFMDQFLWRKQNRPWFLEKFNNWLRGHFGHINKILFFKFPKAFKDVWHFTKMILVGYFVYTHSENPWEFIVYAVAWNLAWWVFFDKIKY